MESMSCWLVDVYKRQFLNLGQKLVICKLAVCQHDPDHFFKGTSTGAANGREKPRDDVLFVEVLYLKVIEALRPFFVGKELDVLFDDGLVFLVNAQIHREQRSAVGKEALGVEQRVFQMVVPHIRLGEGGVDEIVCGLSLIHILMWQERKNQKMPLRK